MSSHNAKRITWKAAADLINQEVDRLHSAPTSTEQKRYGEAVLFKEAAFLSATMMRTVSKILTYLESIESMDLDYRERLQRGVLTCYLVECAELWSTYGLPCPEHDAEFLFFSTRLSRLLWRYDRAVPVYSRDSNPLLLGLVRNVRWTVADHLGHPVQQPEMMLPFKGNQGRSSTAAWLYRALRYLTGGDSVNRFFPYVFEYGTYTEITPYSQVGINRRCLGIYLTDDVRQLIFRHKRVLQAEDSADLPDFGCCAPDINWHALQVACRLHNLRLQPSGGRQRGEFRESEVEVSFSEREVFAWHVDTPWQPYAAQQQLDSAPTGSRERRQAGQDSEYLSMSAAVPTQTL